MPSTSKVPFAGSGDDNRHPILEEQGYRVLKQLGHGSFANVKLAYSERDNTNVAIKIISKRDVPKDFLEKFLPREISIVKSLKHPNLVIFLQVSWALYQFIGTSIIILFIIIIIIIITISVATLI